MPDFVFPEAITAILFDKDGTLIDYEQSWGPVNRKAARLASPGDPILQARILKACGVDPRSGRTAADSLFAAGSAADIARRMVAEGSNVPEEELIRSLDLLFASAAPKAVPVAPLPRLFAKLRKLGLRIGIASSDNEKSIRLTAAFLGIENLVDFFCGYDTGHGTKPAPGMVLGYCSVVGCKAENVAVVGDNRHDMEMGRNAGAGASVGVLSGTGTRETLTPLADVCIESVALLPGLFDSRVVNERRRRNANIA